MSPGALSTEELEAISEKYPWFGTAHVLLSKRYYATNDHRFTDQLHRSAVVVGSRKVLYQLIHKAEHIEPETTLPSPVPAQNIEVKMRFKALDVVTAPSSEKTPAGLATQPEPLRETPVFAAIPVVVQPVASNLAELAGDIVNDETGSDTSTGFTADVLPKLEPTLVSAPAEAQVNEHAAISEEHEPAQAFKASDLDPMERDILIEAVQSTIEQEVGASGKEEEEENELGADSYASWLARRAEQLNFGSGSSSVEAEEEEEEETALEPEVEEENSSQEENPLLEQIIKEATSKKPGASNPKQANLIDRFIKLEPKIAAGKAAEYTPGNIAKESLEEDFSFVTETMAQLFAKQGKLDKARKAYRKLIEQHPEKSVYFAAQLKNLDKLKKG